MAQFALTVRRVVALNWKVSPRLYIGQLAVSVAQGTLPLVSAYLAGRLLGDLAATIARPTTQLESGLLVLLVGLMLIQFVMLQLGNLQQYLGDLFALAFDKYVQLRLYAQVHALDQSYYEDQAFNNLLNKIRQNLFSLQNLNRNFLYSVDSLVEAGTSAVALAVLSPILAVVITIALIPTLVIEVRTSFQRWRTWEDERGNDRRQQWYINSLLLDPEALREIKLYGLKDFLLGRWEHHFEATRKLSLKIERRAQRYRTVIGILNALVDLGAQVWLIMRVLGRHLDLGAFVFYRQLIYNYRNAGAGLVRNLHSMQEQSLYVNDYFNLMAMKPQIELAKAGYKVPAGKPPRIEFEGVSFAYPGSAELVLREVSFVLEPGDDLAIVGENGAGKTTLIKLLLRLYDPTAGRILINGHDLRDVDLTSWYGRVGTLFQDFNHYRSFTVGDNIYAGRTESRSLPKAIEQAAQEAGAAQFIDQ
ncbi:MAG TPA: ABC transporter ATP-binding protein, partial [Candidatus Saccharimonas sp.]|nr:ABC transporter ATP-binding protein [Candidatus Saccharimonas sp.]